MSNDTDNNTPAVETTTATAEVASPPIEAPPADINIKELEGMAECLETPEETKSTDSTEAPEESDGEALPLPDPPTKEELETSEETKSTDSTEAPEESDDRVFPYSEAWSNEELENFWNKARPANAQSVSTWSKKPSHRPGQSEMGESCMADWGSVVSEKKVD